MLELEARQSIERRYEVAYDLNLCPSVFADIPGLKQSIYKDKMRNLTPSGVFQKDNCRLRKMSIKQIFIPAKMARTSSLDDIKLIALCID